MLGTLQDKLIAGGLAVALTVSVGGNIKQGFTARDLRTTVRTFDKQLNDPKTGYVARLTTCKANNQILSVGIDRQNASIATNAARGAAAVADATRSVADAQVKTAEAQRKATAILNTQPSGDTACAKVLDVDARLLESLK
ncbi:MULTISPECIES: hypothetical protein [unclassified Sphingopyxis]|uniref:hypothetical protein n=1 Tax=unclassified Sphingopyxis TaxID=2614943 RepID=UPI0028571229|nr:MULTISPECIES: hypothetical protein [unclassified Sphingopyxis]MDR7062002.1 hypothetical protein [Sphingopyxis sp. BE235]MDR7182461.1 hypothetical protein [Sphingopyxis sp. BE249]